MNKKTLFILLGIFIALGIVASFSWWGPYVGFGKNDSLNAELNFSDFSKSATEKISITKNNEEEKIISKESELWMINNFRADQRQIDDFFNALTSLKIVSFVSRNPENYGNFGVTEKEGYVLTLTGADTNLVFIIGKQGTTFSSFYAKKKESDNVYEISGTLRDKLSQSVTAWRDKIIVNIPKESIQKIEVKSPIDPFTITKSKNTWDAEKAGKTAALDETTVSRLLATFSPLEASGFLNNEETEEFQNAKNKTTIRVFSDNKTGVAEIRLLEKESDWWVQTEGKNVLYKIPSYKFSDIFLSDKDIFKTK